METLVYTHLTLSQERSTPLKSGNLTLSHYPHTPEKTKFPPSLRLNLLCLTVSLFIAGLSAVIPQAAQAQTVLRRGSEGSEVARVQDRLAQLGYLNANSTGFFGSLTEDALRRFQVAQGLQADGVYGPQTAAVLFATPRTPTATPASSTTSLTSDSATAELQDSLAQLGYYKGAIDGIYGPLTEQAVRDFQTDADLPVDGVVGIGTLMALADAINALENPPPASLIDTEIANVDPNSGATVVVQNATDGVLVRQASTESRIVVQQEPQRTYVQTIGSVSPNTISTAPPPTLVSASSASPIYDTSYPNPNALPSSDFSAATGFSPFIVAVPDRNSDTLITVRQFNPNAFLAGSRRGSYIYAGGFVRREDAESFSRSLRQQGLDARVVYRPR
jgi:peptidoglycan hydrolase-like protein with peptidoglycan-binding domain